jgi:hypothetical protein
MDARTRSGGIDYSTASTTTIHSRSEALPKKGLTRPLVSLVGDGRHRSLDTFRYYWSRAGVARHQRRFFFSWVLSTTLLADMARFCSFPSRLKTHHRTREPLLLMIRLGWILARYEVLTRDPSISLSLDGWRECWPVPATIILICV